MKKQLYRVRLLPNSSVQKEDQTLGYLSTNNRIGVYGKEYAIQLAYQHHGVIESNEQEVGADNKVGFFSIQFSKGYVADFFAPIPPSARFIGETYTYKELGFSKKQFFESVLGTAISPSAKICRLEKILPFNEAVIDYAEQKPVKKNIGNITDKEAKHICNIHNMRYNNNPEEQGDHFDLEGFREFFAGDDGYFFSTHYKVRDVLEVILYLQSRGYDMDSIIETY